MPAPQVTLEMRNHDSRQPVENTCILASPDLELVPPTAPTPPAAPESVHSKFQET